MTIREMQEKKRELGYSYEQIAKLSGVPLGTVQKVLTGVTRTPRYDTLSALEAFFRSQNFGSDSGRKSTVCELHGSGSELVREPIRYGSGSAVSATDAFGLTSGKRQGEYTVEDYYRIPDERRVELIDGAFYDMAAPNAWHQLIAGRLFSQFDQYIAAQKGRCIPLFSPIDVRLDCDDRTMVQPDLLILCDRSKLKNRVVYGAPDFVLEILSPSTRKRDLFLKAAKYESAGVREYWIVDPEKRRVLVYCFEKDEVATIYGYRDRIPVGIYEGNCVIDFARVDDYLKDIQGDASAGQDDWA